MSSNLMDTEAGGESSQYESIKTVTEPTKTESGQLGDTSSQDSGVDSQKIERGDKTAENVRYGQGISEGGFGGKTTESEGAAKQDGHGGVAADAKEEDLQNTRREQGYGVGTNIGA